MLTFAFVPLVLSFTCTLGIRAQLSGSVGPTTPLSEKSNLCNVLDYGGSVGSSDIGPAIQSAFDDCVLTNSSASTLYVPEGNYDMQTWVTLNGGTKWAFRLDGLIARAFSPSFRARGQSSDPTLDQKMSPFCNGSATTTGNMIAIEDAEDFEFYSANSAGGIQGLGYECRNDGPRLIRMVTSTDWSLHDLILVDFWCNQSGGSAMGSLAINTSITNILFRYVYTVGGNQAYMIKGNGGSGTVSNVVFEHFITRDTAYGLDINEYWASISPLDGPGVTLENITFKNWDGNVADGVERSPIQIICADEAPCYDITLTDVYMWSLTDEATMKCESAFGSGACLNGYSTTMSGDLTAGFGSTTIIPTPTISTTFYPGRAQISPLMKNL
ncbi:hypothetical protein EVJ58_g7169 [Rhodofomes roseus]|uniref:Glycoside hydrolase family 28 protein n=1 Tax=Rhodofomes roseus TaxID=34475 RepID=A0A4Y9Y5X3_9APHY|nr:hypothetical protein EVJ58_g7169 [Rhodofomes roseus]